MKFRKSHSETYTKSLFHNLYKYTNFMSKEIDTRFTVRPQSEGFEDFFIKVVRFFKFENKKRNVKLFFFEKPTIR